LKKYEKNLEKIWKKLFELQNLQNLEYEITTYSSYEFSGTKMRHFLVPHCILIKYAIFEFSFSERESAPIRKYSNARKKSNYKQLHAFLLKISTKFAQFVIENSWYLQPLLIFIKILAICTWPWLFLRTKILQLSSTVGVYWWCVSER